jgi:hypothetical protein
MYIVADRRAAYGAAYAELPTDLPANATMERLLDAARRNALASSGGQLVHEEDRDVGGFRGRAILIRSPDGGAKQEVRYCIAGNRLYMVIALGPTNPKGQLVYASTAQKVMDSFRVLR